LVPFFAYLIVERSARFFREHISVLKAEADPGEFDQQRVERERQQGRAPTPPRRGGPPEPIPNALGEGPGTAASTPAAEAPVKERIVHVGKIGWPIPVLGATPADWHRIIDLAIRGNAGVFLREERQMMEDGRLIRTTPGCRAEYLQRQDTLVQVRLLEGENAGKTGWIASGFVQ
jgi:hypothetical protein